MCHMRRRIHATHLTLPWYGEEEDTCVSYEEEDTCMSYEEEDTYLGRCPTPYRGVVAGEP